MWCTDAGERKILQRVWNQGGGQLVAAALACFIRPGVQKMPGLSYDYVEIVVRRRSDFLGRDVILALHFLAFGC
jgi:hypothetical protein